MAVASIDLRVWSWSDNLLNSKLTTHLHYKYKKRLQFARAHLNWTVEDWKNVAWSDEFRF